MMVIPVVHCVISEQIELLLCYWHGYDISDMDSMVNVLLTLFRVLLIDLSLPNIFNCKLFRYIFAIFFWDIHRYNQMFHSVDIA